MLSWVIAMSRADLHVHALMREALFFFRGRPGDGRPLARRPGDILSNQVSLDGWRAAGIGLAAVALYSPPVLHRGAGHLGEILRQAQAVERFARAHADRVEIARSPAAARRIAAADRTALLLQVEGGHGIAAPADVEALHAAGVRMITLAHLRDNALAGAAASSSALDGPNYWLTPRRREGGLWLNRRGLSSLGAAVVRAMQDLGVIIDLAHASDRTFAGVLELTRGERTPLVSSHTASRALWPVERNITDEQAQAIVERGGVVGVTLWRRLLQVADPPAGFVSGSVDGFACHFRRLAEVTRSRAVVLGSDMNGMIWRPRGSPACPSGVRHAGDLPALERALAAAGLAREHLERTAEPVLAAWDGVEARARRGRPVAPQEV